MVLIIIKKAPVGKRHDIILIPERPLLDMLEKHVARKGLAKGRSNTCIVTYKKNWTGIPKYKDIVELLTNTIKENRMLEGENLYPIIYQSGFQDLSNYLRCLVFSGDRREPIGDKLDSKGKVKRDTFPGYFVINLVRIRGKSKAAIKEIKRYEPIGMMARLKLKKAFKEVETLSGNEMVFFARHIHPVRSK